MENDEPIVDTHIMRSTTHSSSSSVANRNPTTTTARAAVNVVAAATNRSTPEQLNRERERPGDARVSRERLAAATHHVAQGWPSARARQSRAQPLHAYSRVEFVHLRRLASQEQSNRIGGRRRWRLSVSRRERARRGVERQRHVGHHFSQGGLQGDAQESTGQRRLSRHHGLQGSSWSART